MHDSTLSWLPRNCPSTRTFKRRDYIPLREATLWHIRSGAVRLLTIAEDGSIITLGFWGTGDLVGRPLACIQPCQIECLTNVEAMPLHAHQCQDLNQVMLDHISQMQELIRIRHGPIAQRLRLLLDWLAVKFGQPTEQGHLITLRLTHQQIAEVVGTSRVTVTRWLSEQERDNVIHYSRKQCITLQNYDPRTLVSGF